MLPITNHRVIHIPHSLATLAAIAAVVTALSWDRSDPGAGRESVQTATEHGVIASRADTAGRETVQDTGRQARDESGSGDCACGGGLSNLLPLVLPGAPHR